MTKATHDYTLRLAPPLIVNEKQIKSILSRLGRGVYITNAIHLERRKKSLKIKIPKEAKEKTANTPKLPKQAKEDKNEHKETKTKKE